MIRRGCSNDQSSNTNGLNMNVGIHERSHATPGNRKGIYSVGRPPGWYRASRSTRDDRRLVSAPEKGKENFRLSPRDAIDASQIR